MPVLFWSWFYEVTWFYERTASGHSSKCEIADLSASHAISATIFLENVTWQPLIKRRTVTLCLLCVVSTCQMLKAMKRREAFFIFHLSRVENTFVYFSLVSWKELTLKENWEIFKWTEKFRIGFLKRLALLSSVVQWKRIFYQRFSPFLPFAAYMTVTSVSSDHWHYPEEKPNGVLEGKRRISIFRIFWKLSMSQILSIGWKIVNNSLHARLFVTEPSSKLVEANFYYALNSHSLSKRTIFCFCWLIIELNIHFW